MNLFDLAFVLGVPVSKSGRVVYSNNNVPIWLFHCAYFFIVAFLLLFDFCNVEEPEFHLSASVAHEYMQPTFNAFFSTTIFLYYPF